jgi:hypothetical protein
MRGGKRANAGRPKHRPNKASVAREQQAKASGATPADVMLGSMREFCELARASKSAAKRIEYLRAAAAIARDAAPYFHAKRASKGDPVAISLPAVRTASDVTDALAAITAAMAGGQLSPAEANEVAGIIELQRRGIETVEIVARLARLEEKMVSDGQ